MSQADNANNDGARILIVDDVATNRTLLKKLLEKCGYSTTCASSGPEALDLLKREPVDLVLLDIMMPEMSGHAVLLKMKEEEGLKDIPVIFITGLNENGV